MKPREIAARIAEMKAGLVYSGMGGLILSMRPDRARILELFDLPPDGFIQHGRKTGPMHKLAIAPYFHGGEVDGSTNLGMIKVWPNLMILELGHLLAEEDYFDKRPLFEFVRHVRNAIAHGGRFHIKGKWWRDAIFDGIQLSKDYDGRLLKDAVLPGDMLALIDAVELQLMELS
ncbi:hypothetical protein [Pseudarthrobacter sp. L1SW]|uniref:hypothetical protein n=1 Tax=Pseudarthrobacter sp. L1SW TaxID=2851598 RepID=UPI001E3A0E0C|nr:hypothetical protein [Pseudarthrobacter sp. L1SW]UEL29462.1 hypothetical protein KTR40_04875 [Pseudarthrobacter sp. L1SW]